MHGDGVFFFTADIEWPKCTYCAGSYLSMGGVSLHIAHASHAAGSTVRYVNLQHREALEKKNKNGYLPSQLSRPQRLVAAWPILVLNTQS
eukprot:1750963-Rhodomonas_salina.2